MLKSTLPALNLVLAFDACDQALSLQAPEDSNTTANNAKVTSKNQRAFDHANRTAALVGHSIPMDRQSSNGRAFDVCRVADR